MLIIRKVDDNDISILHDASDLCVIFMASAFDFIFLIEL